MRESIHALRCDLLCLQDTQSKRPGPRVTSGGWLMLINSSFLWDLPHNSSLPTHLLHSYLHATFQTRPFLCSNCPTCATIPLHTELHMPYKDLKNSITTFHTANVLHFKTWNGICTKAISISVPQKKSKSILDVNRSKLLNCKKHLH